MKFQTDSLGNYIKEHNEKNKDLLETNLLGVTISKKFIPSIANTNGTNFKNYKIISYNDFVYGPVTSRNGDKISIALFKEDNSIVSQSYKVFSIRNENILNPDFLMLWFEREEFDRYARFHSHGSTREVFTWKKLCDTEIPVPDIETQDKIVQINETILKRIKIKEKLNNNLSKLSTIIHREFIKKMENNKESIFKELNELGNIVMGQSPKGESYNYDNIGLPLINGAADYENGFLKAQKYTSDPKKTADKNDLIFCIRATIGLLVISDKKYCLGRGVAGITNINQTYKEYSFHLIKSSIENFKRAATGSVISGISRKDIENIVVKNPSNDEIKEYHSIQKPIFDKIEDNRLEINKLTKLRDTLLPKLMSGEIDVSKINFDLI